MYHKSVNPDFSSPNLADFWEKYRPKSQSGRSLLYRYEHNGILVYDSCARFSTEPCDSKLGQSPKEISSQVKKEIENSNEYDRLQFLSMKNYSAVRSYPYEYTLVVPSDNTLKFNSKFEGGNLYKAIKVSENEYNLLLDYDTETKGHTQWYYFSVKNYKKSHYVRFNIINLMKYESLYNTGMKPLVYSKKKFKYEKIEWHRDCTSISYYQNAYPRTLLLPSMANSKFFYSLTFSYFFQYENDTVYFAHCYPYTYTDLTTYLEKLSENKAFEKFLRIDPLCKSIAGNTCFMLTITSKIDTYNSWNDEYEKLQKTTAGRRYIKLKELKKEMKGKNHENKFEEGKS